MEGKLSDLAKRYLSIIEEKGTTFYQLEKESGFSQQVLYNIKKGKNNPSLNSINLLLKQFPEINPEWLNFGKGNTYINSKEEFILHGDKNILDMFTLDEIVAFIIENEEQLLKNSAVFKEYILSLKENAIQTFLIENLKKD